MYVGIGKQVRAFPPSRSLSAIMNKVIIDSQYYHLETMSKNSTGFKVDLQVARI